MEEGALGRGILTSYYLRSYLATACAGSAEPDKAERGIRAGGTMDSARRSPRPECSASASETRQSWQICAPVSLSSQCEGISPSGGSPVPSSL